MKQLAEMKIFKLALVKLQASDFTIHKALSQNVVYLKEKFN